MIENESLKSYSSTLVPQPVFKRTRRTIITYLTVGITFILITVGVIGIVHLYRTRATGFPKPQQQQSAYNSISKSEDLLTIKYHERLADSETVLVNQLRNGTEEYYTKPYMHDNSYLVKWLRECDWNVDEAQEKLLQHFEWRKEKNIDNILKENFTYWEEEFPYYTNASDFQGRPVAAADVSLWDMRKVVTSGRSEELLRYGHYQIEKGIQAITQAQAEGKNVTQTILVVNLDHFNIAQHACFTCIPVLAEYLFDAADHYPGWVHRIILINTPEAFELILSLAAPANRGENKEAVMIFGTNKKEWEDVVFSLIPRDQLPPRFGGNKVIDRDQGF